MSKNKLILLFLCMSSTLRLYPFVYELTVLIQVPSSPKHVTSLCSTFTAKFSISISVIRSDNLHITKINFATRNFWLKVFVSIQTPYSSKQGTLVCRPFAEKLSSPVLVFRSDNLDITKINFVTEIFHGHI